MLYQMIITPYQRGVVSDDKEVGIVRRGVGVMR